MTARNEAVETALLAYVQAYTGEASIEDADREGYVVDDMRACMEEAIDAIPAHLLITLATERGDDELDREAREDGCWVEGCGDRVYARHLCREHHEQWADGGMFSEIAGTPSTGPTTETERSAAYRIGDYDRRRGLEPRTYTNPVLAADYLAGYRQES